MLLIQLSGIVSPLVAIILLRVALFIGEKQQYPLWLINAALTIAILACVLFWLRRVSCGVPMDVPYEERPDCEIDSFADNDINLFVVFWTEGIDEGKNRVGRDLLLTML